MKPCFLGGQIKMVKKVKVLFTVALVLGVATFGANLCGLGSGLFVERAYADERFNPIGSNVFVEVAKNQNPAVVHVSHKGSTAKKRDGSGNRKGNPFGFRERNHQGGPNPFGNMPPNNRREPRSKGGMGSGFLIDEMGYILTNHHVVEGADEVTVGLDNKKEYDAKVIGTDPKTDIALLKIEPKDGDPKNFPYLRMGNSDSLQVGEWVMAIGNPFGLDHTVTVGVVSAKGRNIGAGPYDEFIQTDASINPGNSGGPLLNIEGKVIGINTAIISGNTGGNVGIGFATPINVARKILDDLKEKGSVTRGWLGVMVQEITPDLASTFGLEGSDGALVGNVIPNSPASDGGIKRGDVIVKFDNSAVIEMTNLPKLVAGANPGSTVPVEVIRDGKSKQLNIKIAVLEEESVKTASLGKPLGVQTQDISPELAERLNLEEITGVLVSDVDPDSPAARSGIRRGDVILEINRKQVKNMKDYYALAGKKGASDTLLMLVKRGGTSIYIAVK
jgi:serine protease Do